MRAHQGREPQKNSLVAYCRSDTSTHNLNVHRKLDEIRPEEFSASYRRIVQRDFTNDGGVAEYTILNTTPEQRKDYKGLLDLLYRVNVIRDSMDEDEDFVLPVNFPAVGSILLEFTYSLSEHMVRDTLSDSEQLRQCMCVWKWTRSANGSPFHLLCQRDGSPLSTKY